MKLFLLFCIVASLPSLFRKKLQDFKKRPVFDVLGHHLVSTEQGLTFVYKTENLKVSGHENLKIWLPEMTFLINYKKLIVIGDNTTIFKGIPQVRNVRLNVFEDEVQGRYRFVSDLIDVKQYYRYRYSDTFERMVLPIAQYHIVLYGYKNGMNLVMDERVSFFGEGLLPRWNPATEIKEVDAADKPDLHISNFTPEVLVSKKSLKTFGHVQKVKVEYLGNVTEKIEGKPYLTPITAPKLADLKKLPNGRLLLESKMTLIIYGQKIPAIVSFAPILQGSTANLVVIKAKILRIQAASIQDFELADEAENYFYNLGKIWSSKT